MSRQIYDQKIRDIIFLSYTPLLRRFASVGNSTVFVPASLPMVTYSYHIGKLLIPWNEELPQSSAISYVNSLLGQSGGSPISSSWWRYGRRKCCRELPNHLPRSVQRLHGHSTLTKVDRRITYPSNKEQIMVLGLISAIAACPAIVGTTEAVRQGQRNNAKERHRGRKSNLIVSCANPSRTGREIDGCAVVLRDSKVWPL